MSVHSDLHFIEQHQTAFWLFQGRSGSIPGSTRMRSLVYKMPMMSCGSFS